MTNYEKAYIAGIIDGEGSIMLLQFHNNQLPSPCISVASTSCELLDWLKAKIGTGIVKSKKNYKPDIHQSSYTYTIKYNDALKLLAEVAPYLVITSKKQRANMILSEYKKLIPRNGRYTESQLYAKMDFYQRFIKT